MSNPYLPSYESMMRLMFNQCEDGELLLDSPAEVENRCVEQFSRTTLRGFARQCPKAVEFNRVVLSAALSYSTGIAKGMVEYGVENGFDV